MAYIFECETSPEQISAALERAMEQAFAQCEERFARAGQAAVERAQASDSYRDRTGSLRSSIGWGVFRYGRIVRQGGFDLFAGPEGDGSRGRAIGLATLQRAAGELSRKPLAFAFVVGMDYWEELESQGKDVVTAGALAAGEELRG